MMKTILALAVIAVLAGEARADWKDIKAGMDYGTAVRCAGVPLMEIRGKGGCETWTYDYTGYIQFQYGHVTYWEQPKAPIAQAASKPAATAVAQSANPTRPAPSRAAARSLVAKN